MTYRNHLKQIADDGVPRGPEAVFDRAVLTGSDPGIRRSVASRGRNLVLIVAGAGVAAGLIAIATIRRPTTERTTASPSVSTMPLSALPPISTSSTTQPVATSSVTTAPTALTITAPTIFETPLAPFTGDDLADCVSLARSSAASIPAGYTIDVGRPMGYPARGCELFYRSDGQPSVAIARASKPQTFQWTATANTDSVAQKTPMRPSSVGRPRHRSLQIRRVPTSTTSTAWLR